jgi:hypothetical protein
VLDWVRARDLTRGLERWLVVSEIELHPPARTIIEDSTLAAVVRDERLVGRVEDDDRLILSPFGFHCGQQNLSFPGDPALGTHQRRHHRSRADLGKFTTSPVQGQ